METKISKLSAIIGHTKQAVSSHADQTGKNLESALELKSSAAL